LRDRISEFGLLRRVSKPDHLLGPTALEAKSATGCAFGIAVSDEMEMDPCLNQASEKGEGAQRGLWLRKHEYRRVIERLGSVEKPKDRRRWNIFALNSLW